MQVPVLRLRLVTSSDERCQNPESRSGADTGERVHQDLGIKWVPAHCTACVKANLILGSKKEGHASAEEMSPSQARDASGGA